MSAHRPADGGRLVEVDLLGAELGGHQAEQAGAGADVGDDGLARPDNGGERLVERLVADPVGDERAVVFDAHGAS